MKYAAKKIGLMLLTMVIVSFLAFLAFQVIPGDPAVKLLGTEATPERIAALRAEMGLDRPFLERYVQWVLGACTGTSARRTAIKCRYPACWPESFR